MKLQLAKLTKAEKQFIKSVMKDTPVCSCECHTFVDTEDEGVGYIKNKEHECLPLKQEREGHQHNWIKRTLKGKEDAICIAPNCEPTPTESKEYERGFKAGMKAQIKVDKGLTKMIEKLKGCDEK